MSKLELTYFTPWLASGERGLSSEAIVQTLTGCKVGRHNNGRDYPHDPADLRRCIRLLDAYPLARLVFKDAMREVSESWARIVDRWDELESQLREEMSTSTNGMAPKTYQLMKEALGICPECGQYPRWCVHQRRDATA